jgi:uncharacterized Fe-S cluster protein YjdI
VRIEEHYQVKVITHDGECINGDSEVLSQVPHALLEPIAAHTARRYDGALDSRDQSIDA